jgi:hypothetical protein
MLLVTVALLGLGLPDESLVGSPWIWSLLACCSQCAHNLSISLHCRHGRMEEETVSAMIIRNSAFILKLLRDILCKHIVHLSLPSAIMSSTRAAFFWHCRYDCAMICLSSLSV